MNEPVADTVRGILDGHIVLSRNLASANHYPAIDVLSSISRIMTDIVTPEHTGKAGFVKNAMAVYREAKELIDIGAYRKGSNPEIDSAMALHGKIDAFLKQGIDESTTFDQALEGLTEICEQTEESRK